MIAVERRPGVHVARLARPPVNGLDAALADALERVLDEAVAAGAAVLHLRSEEGSFCGGTHPDRLAAWLRDGPAALAADAARFDALFRRLEVAPLVVLAEIGGAALGAGLGLALACDLRIAAADAKLGVPEARVGVLPPGGTIARIAAIAGRPVARRLLLTAELVDGREAHRLGLVDRAVEAADLPRAAEATASRIAGLSPGALGAAKAALAEDLASAVSQEAGLFDGLARSRPDQDRFAAFVAQLAAAEPGPAASRPERQRTA